MMELSYRRHRFPPVSSSMRSGFTCVHAQLPRRRGSPRRARARHFLRNRSELGAEVRTGDRAAATAAPEWPPGFSPILLGEPFHGADRPDGLGGLRFAALLGRFCVPCRYHLKMFWGRQKAF